MCLFKWIPAEMVLTMKNKMMMMMRSSDAEKNKLEAIKWDFN